MKELIGELPVSHFQPTVRFCLFGFGTIFSCSESDHADYKKKLHFHLNFINSFIKLNFLSFENI